MNKLTLLFIIFLFLVFLSGLYLTMYFDHGKENMENQQGDVAGSSCPDLLVQKGNVLLLYNTTQPLVDGQNPIPFFNLDEYINYLEIQRNKGIDCPVLYLQQENNAQGQDVYRMRPSPFDLEGGLPSMSTVHDDNNIVKVQDASRENKPYNENNYPSFDPHGQYQGVYTDLDKVHDSTEMNKISDNPMDSNWAGITYTQQMIDSGKYEENNVSRPVLFSPKVAFYPTIQNENPPPIDVL